MHAGARVLNASKVNVAEWLRHFEPNDFVVLKMDIEGAEVCDLAAISHLRDVAADDYKTTDANFFDHTTFGDKTFAYHPSGLCSPLALPTVSGLDDPDLKLLSDIDGSHETAILIS